MIISSSVSFNRLYLLRNFSISYKLVNLLALFYNAFHNTHSLINLLISLDYVVSSTLIHGTGDFCLGSSFPYKSG